MWGDLHAAPYSSWPSWCHMNSSHKSRDNQTVGGGPALGLQAGGNVNTGKFFLKEKEIDPSFPSFWGIDRSGKATEEKGRAGQMGRGEHLAWYTGQVRRLNVSRAALPPIHR